MRKGWVSSIYRLHIIGIIVFLSSQNVKQEAYTKVEFVPVEVGVVVLSRIG